MSHAAPASDPPTPPFPGFQNLPPAGAPPRAALLGDALPTVPPTYQAAATLSGRVPGTSVAPRFGAFSGYEGASGGANLGSGAQLFAGVTGSTLKFRTLVAGANVAIAQDSPSSGHVLISATGGGGGAAPLDLQVFVNALTGDDASGTGTAAFPFASLQRAAAAVRATGWDRTASITVAATSPSLTLPAGALDLNPGSQGAQQFPLVIQGAARTTVGSFTVAGAAADLDGGGRGSSLTIIRPSAPTGAAVGQILRFTGGAFAHVGDNMLGMVDYSEGGGQAAEAFIAKVGPNGSVDAAAALTLPIPSSAVGGLPAPGDTFVVEDIATRISLPLAGNLFIATGGAQVVFYNFELARASGTGGSVALVNAALQLNCVRIAPALGYDIPLVVYADSALTTSTAIAQAYPPYSSLAPPIAPSPAQPPSAPCSWAGVCALCGGAQGSFSVLSGSLATALTCSAFIGRASLRGGASLYGFYFDAASSPAPGSIGLDYYGPIWPGRLSMLYSWLKAPEVVAFHGSGNVFTNSHYQGGATSAASAIQVGGIDQTPALSDVSVLSSLIDTLGGATHTTAAVRVFPGCRMNMDDTWVGDALPGAPAYSGTGVRVDAGGRLLATSSAGACTIQGVGGSCIALKAGALAVLEDGTALRNSSVGVDLSGGELTATLTAFEAMTGFAVTMSLEAKAALQACTVGGAGAAALQGAGGFSLQGSSQLLLQACAVTASGSLGAIAADGGCRVQLKDGQLRNADTGTAAVVQLTRGCHLVLGEGVLVENLSAAAPAVVSLAGGSSAAAATAQLTSVDGPGELLALASGSDLAVAGGSFNLVGNGSNWAMLATGGSRITIAGASVSMGTTGAPVTGGGVRVAESSSLSIGGAAVTIAGFAAGSAVVAQSGSRLALDTLTIASCASGVVLSSGSSAHLRAVAGSGITGTGLLMGQKGCSLVYTAATALAGASGDVRIELAAPLLSSWAGLGSGNDAGAGAATTNSSWTLSA